MDRSTMAGTPRPKTKGELAEIEAKRHWWRFKPYDIGSEGDPYMRRWLLLPHNKWFNAYLHRFMKSDDDRALHDHPFANMSILLKGSYVEHTPEGSRVRSAPAVVWRPAEAAHRIDLIEGRHVWTIFLTGRKVREWGFHCPNGWKFWREYAHKNGCGEQ